MQGWGKSIAVILPDQITGKRRVFFKAQAQIGATLQFTKEMEQGFRPECMERFGKSLQSEA